MRERVRRRRRIAAGAVAALLLLAAAGYAATFTSLFAADTVRVSGVDHLSEARVVRLADVAPGTNVVHLDPAQAESRLERDPWIATAIVTRVLPSTLVIRVQERSPVAVAPDGRVLAADGTVLPGAVATDLPVLRATVGALTVDDERAAMTAVAALAPDVRERVQAVLVDPAHEVRLALAGDVLATFGPSGQEDEKATALRALLRWADVRNVALATIDVEVPSAPAATLKDGTTVTP